jgi:hypothetical protein
MSPEKDKRKEHKDVKQEDNEKGSILSQSYLILTRSRPELFEAVITGMIRKNNQRKA